VYEFTRMAAGSTGVLALKVISCVVVSLLRRVHARSCAAFSKINASALNYCQLQELESKEGQLYVNSMVGESAGLMFAQRRTARIFGVAIFAIS
jgi:hypothetical protein